MILDDTSTAIYLYLSAGTALTALLPGTSSIYRTQAPDNATLPYVVFSHQGGGPELLTPQRLETNLWYIRAYSDVSQKDADEIFHQVDQILNEYNPTLIYHHTIRCVRVENISFVENAPDGKVWNSGGIYEIRTSTPAYPTGTPPASYVYDRDTYLGYTEYVALLTQSGTNAPTATVVKNDTGATVSYAYILTGVYTMTFSSAVLTANKAIAILQKNLQGNTAFTIAIASTTLINIYTTTAAGAAANGLMTDTPLIVRIYI